MAMTATRSVSSNKSRGNGPRKAGKAAHPIAAQSRAPGGAASAPARATPELAFAVRTLMACGHVGRRPTLGALRTAVQGTGMTWSIEGELLFPQDRTSLVIEIDELIDGFGARAPALDFLGRAEE